MNSMAGAPSCAAEVAAGLPGEPVEPGAPACGLGLSSWCFELLVFFSAPLVSSSLLAFVAVQSYLQRAWPMVAMGKTPGRACAGAEGPPGPGPRRRAGVSLAARLAHGCHGEDPWQGMREG